VQYENLTLKELLFRCLTVKIVTFYFSNSKFMGNGHPAQKIVLHYCMIDKYKIAGSASEEPIFWQFTVIFSNKEAKEFTLFANKTDYQTLVDSISEVSPFKSAPIYYKKNDDDGTPMEINKLSFLSFYITRLHPHYKIASPKGAQEHLNKITSNDTSSDGKKPEEKKATSPGAEVPKDTETPLTHNKPLTAENDPKKDDKGHKTEKNKDPKKVDKKEKKKVDKKEENENHGKK